MLLCRNNVIFLYRNNIIFLYRNRIVFLCRDKDNIFRRAFFAIISVQELCIEFQWFIYIFFSRELAPRESSAESAACGISVHDAILKSAKGTPAWAEIEILPFAETDVLKRTLRFTILPMCGGFLFILLEHEKLHWAGYSVRGFESDIAPVI